MKNKPFITGIIAAVSPFPMFWFTMLWSWVWFFGIGLGMLQYDRIPDWMLIVELLPLCISPLLGLLGIVHGIIKRKTRLAWLGILLSVLCLIENVLLLAVMAFLSRF